MEWDRKNYYFCSHFVSTDLAEGKVLQANKPLTLMRPTDILEALPFVLLYECKLFQFNELSMSAVEQGPIIEAEKMIASLEMDSADLLFPDNFLPVPVL